MAPPGAYLPAGSQPPPDQYAQQWTYPSQPGYPQQPPGHPPTGGYPAGPPAQPAKRKGIIWAAVAVVALVVVAVLVVTVAVPLVTAQAEVSPKHIDQIFEYGSLGLENVPDTELQNPESYFVPANDDPCLVAAGEVLRTGSTAQQLQAEGQQTTPEVGYVLAWQDTKAAQQAFDKLRPALRTCRAENEERNYVKGDRRFICFDGALNPENYWSMCLVQYGNVMVFTQLGGFRDGELWYEQIVATLKYFSKNDS